MKKCYSFLAALLVLSLILPVFSACGSKDKDSQSLKEAIDDLPVKQFDDANKLLDKIKDIDVTAPPASEAKIKISAVLPEGWVEEKKTHSIVSYIKGTNFIDVYEVWKPSEVNDLKGLAEYEKKLIAESFKDAEIHDIENIKLSGADAVRVPIDISLAGIKQRQTYVYIEKGGKYYKIMLACFLDDEEGMKEMDSILKSMKIE